MRVRVTTRVPYPWVVVTLCVLVLVSTTTFRQGIGIFFPFIQDDLGVNRAELGVIAAVINLSSGFSSIPGGWLADMTSVRRLVAVTLLLLAGCALLFSQIQNLVHAVLAAVLIGVVLSPAFPGCAKATMDWVPPRACGSTIGILEASFPLGIIIAGVTLPSLAVAFSWRIGVMSVALVIATMSAAFFALYRDRTRSSKEGQNRRRLGEGTLAVVKDRDLWVASFYGAAFGGIYGSFVSFLVLFVEEHLHSSAVVGGGILAVAMAGSVLGRVGWGLVSDLLFGGRRIRILALMGTLSALSLALMAWLPSDAPLAVAMLVGFAVGCTSLSFAGLWTTLIAELSGPALMGTGIGFAGLVVGVCSLAIIPVFGLIVDRTGSYDLGWWMLVGLAGVATLNLALLTPAARRR